MDVFSLRRRSAAEGLTDVVTSLVHMKQNILTNIPEAPIHICIAVTQNLYTYAL